MKKLLLSLLIAGTLLCGFVHAMEGEEIVRKDDKSELKNRIKDALKTAKMWTAKGDPIFRNITDLEEFLAGKTIPEDLLSTLWFRLRKIAKMLYDDVLSEKVKDGEVDTVLSGAIVELYAITNEMDKKPTEEKSVE